VPAPDSLTWKQDSCSHSVYWSPSLLTNFNPIPQTSRASWNSVVGRDARLQPQQWSVLSPSAHMASWHAYISTPAASHPAGVGGNKRVLQMTSYDGEKAKSFVGNRSPVVPLLRSPDVCFSFCSDHTENRQDFKLLIHLQTRLQFPQAHRLKWTD